MKKIIFIFLILISDFVYSQSSEENKIRFENELNRIKANSFVINGRLIDFNLGTECGVEPGAGLFVFEVLKSNGDDLTGKQVLVTIQCAASRRDFFLKNQNYNLSITKEKASFWIDVIYEKFDNMNLSKYYCINILE